MTVVTVEYMHLAMSGLGAAVEDLRAATWRFGRELFLPVGPARQFLMDLDNFHPEIVDLLSGTSGS